MPNLKYCSGCDVAKLHRLTLNQKVTKGQVVKRLPNRYNRVMEVKKLHNWQLSTSEAIELQRRLASRVSTENEVKTPPRFIGGVDISVRRGQNIATGSAVVLNYPELEVVETKTARDRLNFPYVPGLLSFRELPLILKACEQLSVTPDLMLVDGQGIAHPRRFGIASHLGLFLDIPTIGCAKSRLCGSHQEPGAGAGSSAEITDNGETIGAALRTRVGVKPIYVSIGHKIDLLTSIQWVMKCCRAYRLPEPTRLAHQVAKGSSAELQKEAISAGTER